jgi:flagellar biosynthesis GTPase FlhF
MTPSTQQPSSRRWTRIVIASALAVALLGGAALPAVASSTSVEASEDKTAKDAEKAAKDAAKQAEKLAADAQKAQDASAKEAEKASEKAEKEAEKAVKEAEKAADKVAKEAEKASEKAEKEAEKASDKAEKEAEKAVKEAEKAAKETAKEAAKTQKQREKACKKDPTACVTTGNNPGGNNPGGGGGSGGGNPSAIVPLLAAACAPGAVPAAPFRDVANNVHRPSIDCLRWWNLAAGLSAEAYGPGRPVTRGQTATFFARLIEATGGTLPAAGGTGFRDLGRSVHADSISRMAAAGIVLGVTSKRFAPSQPVTRAQMVTMLVGAHEHVARRPLATGADAFDDDSDNVHQGNINKASSAGLARGQGGRSFNPGGKTRRDQMASFLARLLDQLVSQGHGVPPNRR